MNCLRADRELKSSTYFLLGCGASILPCTIEGIKTDRLQLRIMGKKISFSAYLPSSLAGFFKCINPTLTILIQMVCLHACHDHEAFTEFFRHPKHDGQPQSSREYFVVGTRENCPKIIIMSFKSILGANHHHPRETWTVRSDYLNYPVLNYNNTEITAFGRT